MNEGIRPDEPHAAFGAGVWAGWRDGLMDVRIISTGACACGRSDLHPHDLPPTVSGWFERDGAAGTSGWRVVSEAPTAAQALTAARAAAKGLAFTMNRLLATGA